MGQTVAFFSYARVDDDRDGRGLSFVRQKLEIELTRQMGMPVKVFQDTDDIEVGQKWAERINRALDETGFLVAMITPAYLNSANCIDELARFRAQEKARGLNNLIIPVYWTAERTLDATPPLASEAEEKADADPRAFIKTRQYIDWRPLNRPDAPLEKLQAAILDLAISLRDRLHEIEEERRRKAEEARLEEERHQKAEAQKAEALRLAESERDAARAELEALRQSQAAEVARLMEAHSREQSDWAARLSAAASVREARERDLAAARVELQRMKAMHEQAQRHLEEQLSQALAESLSTEKSSAEKQQENISEISNTVSFTKTEEPKELIKNEGNCSRSWRFCVARRVLGV